MIAVIFTPSKLIRALRPEQISRGYRRKLVRKKTPEPLTSLGPRSVERWQCPGGDNDMLDFAKRGQSPVWNTLVARRSNCSQTKEFVGSFLWRARYPNE